MSFSRVSSALSFIVFLCAPVAAQQAEGISVLYEVKAKAGMMAQWEEGYKKHLEWHKGKQDQWTWLCWEYVTGEKTGTFLIRTAGHSWADFDARGAMLKEDRDNAFATIGSFTESITSVFTRNLPDVSNLPSPDSQFPMVQIFSYQVRLDRQQQFMEAVRKVHAELEKAQWPRTYIWVVVALGGEAPGYRLAIPTNKWADLEPPEKSMMVVLTEALGEAEARKLMMDLEGSIESTRSDLLVLRPELSYRPQE